MPAVPLPLASHHSPEWLSRFVTLRNDGRTNTVSLTQGTSLPLIVSLSIRSRNYPLTRMRPSRSSLESSG